MKAHYLFLYTLTFFLWLQRTTAQTLTQFGPDGFVKIENNSGGFMAALDSGDRFSRDHDQAGDINGDGVIDLVVGARSDDDGATDAGAVYILFMNADGTVQSNQKNSALEGGFTGNLSQGSFFGYGVAGVGDYDGDGVPDVAATASGVVYLLHLNTDGTVKNSVRSEGINSQGLSAVGDLDGDGRIDLVAGQSTMGDGRNQRGQISILFLDEASRVVPARTVVIGDNQGGFGAGLADNDRFGGREVAMLGDLDGDGTKEMAVGAFMSDGGKGAIWILSIDPTTFNVVAKTKITEGMNGFTDALTTGDNPNGTAGAQFGHALCRVGDLNGDGVADLMTGANQQAEGWGYILYLNADKTVKTFTRINNEDGGFGLTLEAEERFSRSISFVGDLRGDGTVAVNYGGGAGGTGTLYLLFLQPCAFEQQAGNQRWSGGTTLFTNWSHNAQAVTGDSLSFEQCTFEAFATDAAHMTYNFNDGRCICLDENVTLVESTEGSTAYINRCFSGTVSTTTSGPEAGIGLTLYPNPAADELILETDHSSVAPGDNCTIFSVSGRRLFTADLQQARLTRIDVSAYPRGTYLLVARINGSRSTRLFVKE